MLLNAAFFTMVIFFLNSCSPLERNKLSIYVSNRAEGRYDRAKFGLEINGKKMFTDSLVNSRVSEGNFRTYNVSFPKNKVRLKAKFGFKGELYEKDTLVKVDIGENIFIGFEFLPNRRKFENPEIYKYILTKGQSEVNLDSKQFKRIVDSLYTNHTLSSEYVRDSVPSGENISILIKK